MPWNGPCLSKKGEKEEEGNGVEMESASEKFQTCVLGWRWLRSTRPDRDGGSREKAGSTSSDWRFALATQRTYKHADRFEQRCSR